VLVNQISPSPTATKHVRVGLVPALHRILLLVFALVAVWQAVGCGGGGSSSPPPPPPPAISVSLSPTTASLGFTATQQFTATVTGTTNTAVTWSVSPSVGAVSSSGLYTAPSAPSLPPPLGHMQTVLVTAGQTSSAINVNVTPLLSSNTVTVTATSQADTTKSASATVTITALSLIAVGTCDSSGSCSAGSSAVPINPGQSVTLFVVGTAVVNGTSYNVSGNGDVTVTQPTSSDFCSTSGSSPLPCVTFPLSASSGATPGARNLLVTNSNNELSVFPGAILICPSSGCSQ
jgi:hypothetical protein